MKSEIRNPKSERNPSFEFRIPNSRIGHPEAVGRSKHTSNHRIRAFFSGFGLRTSFGFRISSFGLLSDFGFRASDFFRISDFGFRIFVLALLLASPITSLASPIPTRPEKLTFPRSEEHTSELQ